MSDVWAKANAQQAQGTGGGVPEGASQVLPEQGAESQLFGGGGQGAGPSLMNKTHAVGTKRHGVIKKAPYDRHSTKLNGKPKYWQQGSNSPVEDAVNAGTGEKNRPVMDTVVALETEYVMDAAEARELTREAPFEGGARSVTLGSKDDLEGFREAMADFSARMKAAGKPEKVITSGKDVIGLVLTVERYAEKPNPNGGPTIKMHRFHLDLPNVIA